MHESQELETLNIPPFLAKLGKLVDDPDTDHLICWSDSGDSFLILDTIRFTKELLPRYYKHNNLASFIRQLNMYGFHKIQSLDSGSLDNKRSVMEFSHLYFIRDHPYLMENIQRKMPTRTLPIPTPTLGKVGIKTESGTAEMMAQILAEVNEVKKKQSGWDQKMANMKRENESLWRELAIFRQKHLKQEQIINRLIQFIVTMLRPSARGTHVPLRRRYQLMLDGSKQPSSSSGPTIRELDPVEQFLMATSSYFKDGKAQPNQSSSARLDADDVVEDEMPIEYLESPSDPSYVVLSPEDPASVPAPASWLTLDESDVDDAAMTPINPYDVNPRTPVPVTIIKPATFKAAPEANKNRPTSSLKSQTRTLPVISVNPVRVPASSSKAKASPAPKLIKLQPSAETQSANLKVDTRNSANKPKPKARKQKSPKRAIKKKPTKATEANAQADEAAAIDEAFLKEAIDMITGDEKKDAKPITDLSDIQGIDTTLPTNVDTKSDQDQGNLAVVRPSTSSYGDDLARDLGSHVDQVQGDIDILRELLKGDNYNLDANTILELFNDDPMNLIMSSSPSDNNRGENEGQELMAYNTPNFLDLADIYAPTPAMEMPTDEMPHPSSPTPSGLETPTFIPSSPCFPPAAKKRRKQ